MPNFSKPSLNQGSQNHPPIPKIRNLGNGFILLTVGPYQETVQPHEIHEVTANLQHRYQFNFLTETENCYILSNRKNFLECLHQEAQKLKP